MIHLNSNVLCAISIKTTGPNPAKHELIEICVIPLDPKLGIDKTKIPFNLYIKPDFPDRVDWDHCKIRDHDFMRICETGFDKYEAAEMFDAWFRKLKLPERKRIMPLAHDWASQRDYIKEWLQPTDFALKIDHRYRDTMVIGSFLNDYNDRRNEQCPFPKVKLTYMAAMTKIDYVRPNNVVEECDIIIKLYRALVATRV